jgi:hypothetical protein
MVNTPMTATIMNTPPNDPFMLRHTLEAASKGASCANKMGEELIKDDGRYLKREFRRGTSCGSGFAGGGRSLVLPFAPCDIQALHPIA